MIWHWRYKKRLLVSHRAPIGLRFGKKKFEDFLSQQYPIRRRGLWIGDWEVKKVRLLACHRTPIGLSPALLVGEHYSLPAPHHPLTTAPCCSPEKHKWGWKDNFQILLLCFRVTSSQGNRAERSSLANLQPTDIWGNMAVPIPNVLIKNPAKQPWGQSSRPMRSLGWEKADCDWLHK